MRCEVGGGRCDVGGGIYLSPLRLKGPQDQLPRRRRPFLSGAGANIFESGSAAPPESSKKSEEKNYLQVDGTCDCVLNGKI